MKKSKEALIGATLYSPQTKSGTTANEYGYYSFTLKAGASRMGCASPKFPNDMDIGLPWRPCAGKQMFSRPPGSSTGECRGGVASV